MKKRSTIEQKILARIGRKKSAVLLREDFLDLGGYDQVGRSLRLLADKGRLLRIGYGLFAKAKVSSLTGETIPLAPLPSLAREALGRLGVKTLPSQAELAYNEGRSPQIPTGRLICVTSRVNRKIGLKGASISYEYRT